MTRVYRNIARDNNLMALGSGLSQAKSDSNFIVKIKVPAITIEAFIVLIKAYTINYIGGFE